MADEVFFLFLLLQPVEDFSTFFSAVIDDKVESPSSSSPVCRSPDVNLP